MDLSAYKQLAERLNALPNRFPPTDNDRELKLLGKRFTPEGVGHARRNPQPRRTDKRTQSEIQ